MEQLLQQTASGLANGAIYACLALALVMIFVSTDHINFAQGELSMFSAYLVWQMLAISRALMLGPRLMLLDEPSFGLAPLIVQEIFRIMRRINGEAGVSMLLVEQNAALALELADHAYVLETGRVVMSGKSSAVKSDEAIRKSYLGY